MKTELQRIRTDLGAGLLDGLEHLVGVDFGIRARGHGNRALGHTELCVKGTSERGVEGVKGGSVSRRGSRDSRSRSVVVATRREERVVVARSHSRAQGGNRHLAPRGRDRRVLVRVVPLDSRLVVASKRLETTVGLRVPVGSSRPETRETRRVPG